MPEKVVPVTFSEFLQSNVQDLVNTMDWMKGLDMRLCESMEQLKAFIDQAIQRNICALDLEATGLNTRMSPANQPYIKVVGISLACDGISGIYVPVNHREEPESNLPEYEVFQEIKRLCQNCVIIVHNAKYDLQVLKNEGIVVNQFDRFEDTLILARLYDAGQKELGLKALSQKILGRKMIDFEEATGGTRLFALTPPKIGYVYAVSDALCTYSLYEFFISQKTIIDQKPIYNLEKHVVPVVMQMEANLITIDKPYLVTTKTTVLARMAEIEKSIKAIAKRDFNVGSTQQLGKVLFEELGYEYPENKKTASGQYKTDTSTLEKIADKYPIVKNVIEYRGLEKSQGTYIENLVNNCDERNCVKLSFNQTGTDTGRFSSPGGKGINLDGYSAVNVQSLPANYDSNAPDIRKAFIARPGMKIVACDFSGEELRVAANLSKEKKWVDEFLYGSADLHTATAKAIFHKDNIEKAERQIAKCVAVGTLVRTFRGDIPVEQVLEGDLVWTHRSRLQKVTQIWDMGTKPGINFSAISEDGTHTITCGVNHRFLKLGTASLMWAKVENIKTGISWTRAEDLKIGDKILSRKKGKEVSVDTLGSNEESPFQSAEITAIEFKDAVELRDLSVSEDESYVAEGLVSHNTCNFLTLYGGGPRGLAEQAKISEREAKRILTSFFDGLPQLTKWIENERRIARRTKSAVTAFGRIRPLQMFYDTGDRGQEAHADRCATNFLVQGCCADIMKTVMVRVSSWMRNNNLQDEIKILITMHDELVFEMPENRLIEFIPSINSIMPLADILQGILKWPVPLTIDAEYGDSWHVDHDFFKEHPELKNSSPVEFSKPTSVVVPETPATPAPTVEEAPKPAETPAIPVIVETPAPVLEESKKGEPQVAPEPISQPSTPADPVVVAPLAEELVYTVKQTRRSTLRILNSILSFLQEEKDSGLYSDVKKVVRLCDRDGNSLLVSDIKVSPDAFMSLVRYFGV